MYPELSSHTPVYRTRYPVCRLSEGREAGLDANELHTDPLYVKVYLLLKQRILSGHLAAGERLRETAVAADLQVSRTPVRDALRRLEQDGLIVAVAGSAYAVFRPCREDLVHLYEARAIIEGGAARLAASRGDGAACTQMADVLAEMERAYQGMADRLIDLDTRFHELLVAASANPVLAELHARLGTRLRQLRTASGDVTVRGSHILEQHAAMLAALGSRDPLAAEAATRTHIDFVCTSALRAFDDRQPPQP